jgi:hypothetical protein
VKLRDGTETYTYAVFTTEYSKFRKCYWNYFFIMQVMQMAIEARSSQEINIFPTLKLCWHLSKRNEFTDLYCTSLCLVKSKVGLETWRSEMQICAFYQMVIRWSNQAMMIQSVARIFFCSVYFTLRLVLPELHTNSLHMLWLLSNLKCCIKYLSGFKMFSLDVWFQVGMIIIWGE